MFIIILAQMKDSQQILRIKMLENRMRKPSKPPTLNEQSLKSIKSTDSKKILMPVHILTEQPRQESLPPDHHQHIRLTEEQIKTNKKITDYFFKNKKKRQTSPQVSPQPTPADIGPPPTQAHNSRSPTSPVHSRHEDQDMIRDEMKGLREAVKERDELLVSFRNEIVESTIKLHKAKKTEMRQRVSYNKWRLGQLSYLKTSTEHWIDGVDIRQCKEKLQQLKKEKQLLEKSKRQARRGKDQQEVDQWKITFSSQAYFLSRQEAHCQQTLKRLQEEKALHIKQYRLLNEEDSSRYGKQVALGTHSWPLIRKYQLLGLLGKGGFSEVYKGFDVEQLKEVAVKVHQFKANWPTQAKDNYIKHAFRENSVHRILSHPNIVRLYDTVQVDANSFCTVLQYCQGPDLSYYLKKHKKIPERQAKLIIRQVASAIRYLHELPDKVIHYDLKPQNILFHKGRVKITDFGLCKITKEENIELTSQGVGTYWYLPPECFSEEKGTIITPKVDVWSIGVIYFQMLYGEKPFGNAMTQMRILKEGIMLKAHTVNFPKGVVTPESKQFIKECLQFKAEARLNIRGVTEHRLFKPK